MCKYVASLSGILSRKHSGETHVINERRFRTATATHSTGLSTNGTNQIHFVMSKVFCLSLFPSLLPATDCPSSWLATIVPVVPWEGAPAAEGPRSTAKFFPRCFDV